MAFIKTNISKQGSKTFKSILVVEGYRENGKVKHRTLMNISKWHKDRIDLLGKVLKGQMLASIRSIKTKSGKKIGGIWVLHEIAKRLGLVDILTSLDKNKALLSLVLIYGRILTQGSRLHLVEWQHTQELEKVIGNNTFNENELYQTLDFLSDNKERIENALFEKRYDKTNPPTVYLYDVSSSYLEGVKNEFAAFGYNRDKKKGKMQITFGMLTDKDGNPMSVNVYDGNTPDIHTVDKQLNTLKKRFGSEKVVFVGDRGMLKQSQIDSVIEHGYDYITCLTKKQIENFEITCQIGLFDSTLCEVVKDNTRYIYRRNPIRADEIEMGRIKKIHSLNTHIEQSNNYLKKHDKAKVATQIKNLNLFAKKLKIENFISFSHDDRVIKLIINQEQKDESSKYDGVYVMKTSLTDNTKVSKEEIHQAYKNLQKIERGFRIMKTTYLEIRPIYVRKSKRTIGHVFVCMLAYMLLHELDMKTQEIDATLTHKLEMLETIQTVELSIKEEKVLKVPDPLDIVKEILLSLKINIKPYL